jgi:hypothetical protein
MTYSRIIEPYGSNMSLMSEAQPGHLVCVIQYGDVSTDSTTQQSQELVWRNTVRTRL